MRRHAKAPSAGSTSGRASRPRSIRIGVLLALAALLAAASGALALETHPHKGTISGSATPNGAFGTLSGLAVDTSGGDLYATDFSGAGAPVEGTGAVHRFDSTGAYEATIDGQGTPQGELSLSDLADVAVDNSGTGSDGTVYVADIDHNLVDAFGESGAYLSQLDGSNTPAGAFSLPCAVAVDASGNLLVGDSGNNRIWIFDSSGAYLGRVADSKLESPCGLALDSTGELYVRNYSGGKVLKFHRLGAAEYDFSQVFYDPGNGTEEAADDLPPATDVAVDTSTDRVLLDLGDRVLERDSSGSQLSSFGQGTLSSSRGIAVDPASGRIYAADGSALHLFGPLATLPDVTTGEASNVQKESATISGTIDPAGGPDAECEFEWGTDTSYGQSAACDPAGPFSGPAEVSAQLSGLTAGITYHFRIVGSSANGSNPGADRTFATAEAPLFDQEQFVLASAVHSTTATVNARIDPNGFATGFHVEYGLADCASSGCESAPALDADIGSGTEGVFVSRGLTGLTPDTTYHYRFVATSAGGTTESPDRTFHTYALATPTGLPDGRAYEMVSPPAKNGSDVAPITWRTRSSTDGNAVSFMSTGSFSNPEGTSLLSEYVAKRGADGWTTNPLTPATPPGNIPLPAQSRQFFYMGEFSDDLNMGVAFSPTPLTDSSNVANAFNLYLRTNILGGVGPNPDAGAQYTLLTDSIEILNDPEPFIDPRNRRMEFADHTPDLGQVVFESKNNLTSDAAGLSNEEPKTYEWDHGTVRLVGILPDAACGTPPCPAPLSLAGAGGGTTQYGPFAMPHIVSDDGSTVFFTAGPLGDGARDPGGTLYARLNHTSTVQINVSERTDCADHDPCSEVAEPDPNGVEPAHFRGASADGSKVFFVSREALTDDAQLNRRQLYVYDFDAPLGHRIRLVSIDSEPGDPSRCGENRCDEKLGILGISDDGSYAYFSSDERFLPGLPEMTSEANAAAYIYSWHDGTVRYVGMLGSIQGGEPRDRQSPTAPAFEGSGVSRLDSRVTGDGKTLIFATNATNAPFPNVEDSQNVEDILINRAQHRTQVYVYRYEADELNCASCGAANASPAGDAEFQQRGDSPSYALGELTRHLNHALSDDGNRVFFTTPSALVANDTNGRRDAYEYDVATGRVHLLSTGQCNCDSYFVEATPDASDIFIVTHERLVGIDKDNNSDLYDVRIGGGIDAQNPPASTECQGDACLAPAQSPNDPTPSSASFQGAGNPASKAKKHLKKHHRKRSGKRRHKQRAHHRPPTTRSHG